MKLFNTFYRCPLDPSRGTDPGVYVMEWKLTLQDTYGPNTNVCWYEVVEIWTWKTYHNRRKSQVHK